MLTRPAGLRNPKWGAGLVLVDGILSCLHALVKDSVGVFDRRVLEVWVSVHTDEVAGLNDSSIGTVDPSGPRVDVPYPDGMAALVLPLYRSSEPTEIADIHPTPHFCAAERRAAFSAL